MIRFTLAAFISLSLWGAADISWASREYFTAEQKEHLAKIRTVLVETIAITDKGTVPSEKLTETVRQRLEQIGYTVVTNPSQPHDVVVRVKCEQYKTWEGTTTSGGDADLPDAPSRIWKGPACQLGYLLGGNEDQVAARSANRLRGRGGSRASGTRSRRGTLCHGQIERTFAAI